MAAPIDAAQSDTARPRRIGIKGVAGIVAAIIVVVALGALLISRINHANTVVKHAPPPAQTLVGHAAPNITFTAWTLQPGSKISLASLRGHPVVLNVWESSCTPCQAEAPLFAQAWSQYHTRGVTFVGVALETSQSDGVKFLQQHNLTYLAGLAPTTQTVADYRLIGVPDTFFINSQGVIVAQVIGQIDQQKLDADIQKAMTA